MTVKEGEWTLKLEDLMREYFRIKEQLDKIEADIWKVLNQN